MPKTMDKKLVSYRQKHETKHICQLFQITETDLVELVRRLPKEHSRKEVYALLLGAGYSKHTNKKALP